MSYEEIRLARLDRLELWEVIDQIGRRFTYQIDPGSMADREYLGRRLEDAGAFAANTSMPAPQFRCLGKANG
jgi:hypothetical protein